MHPTGDVQGGLRKLETLIRTIKYTGPVNYNSLSSGDPAAFLPIVSYTLTSFSPFVAEQLVMSGFELSGKTDLRFTETVYKVLRDVFQYKPVLTKEQFLQWGFSQRKISVVCDVINLVIQKDNQHKKTKPRSRFPASHKNVKVETISFADLESAVPAKPIVVNHLENPALIPAAFSRKETAPSSKTVSHSVQVERFSSRSPEHGVVEMRGAAEEEEAAVKQCCVELQGRLSALETRIEGLVSGLDRISALEKRLEELQQWRNKDKSEGQTISVSRETWENLLSRVLLLETKLELNGAKENIPPQSPSPPSSYVPNSQSEPQQPTVKRAHTPNGSQAEIFTLPELDNQDDLKERLERITNMLKSTSSLLKSSENSSTI